MPFVKFSVALRFAVRECECDPTRQIEIVKTKTNKKTSFNSGKMWNTFYCATTTDRPANRRTNGPLIERNGWQGRSEWRQRNFRLAFHIVVSHCCCVNCNVLCLCLYKCVCMCAYFMEGSCRWSFFNEVRYNKFHSKIMASLLFSYHY